MPMMGLTPSAMAAFQNSTAPYMTPWSVRATAGWPRALARATSCGMRLRPSSREYSEWQWRWTKDMTLACAGTIQLPMDVGDYSIRESPLHLKKADGQELL